MEPELRTRSGVRPQLQEQLLQEQQQLESNLQPAILEISLLMSTFSAELASQHDSVQYVSDAIVESNDNVIRGRSELQKAAKRPSFMKEFVVTFILVMAAALLLLDWITP